MQNEYLDNVARQQLQRAFRHLAVRDLYIKPALSLGSGSIKALLRRYQGSITALLRRYQGSIKAL